MSDRPQPTASIETLRLHQSNERTMLAWMRTGIALMAFGFAIARFGLFMRQLSAINALSHTATRSLESNWIGVVLVCIGVVTNLFATARFHRVRRAIEIGNVGEPVGNLVYVLGGLLVLVGLVMAILLARAMT